MTDALEAGLRRVATADRLLVASDFDGTLAGIVDHPDAVVPDLEAIGALRALAELPATWVAVLSGRSRAVLVEHLGDAGLTLVGGHGAELDDSDDPDDGTALATPERRTLDRATGALEALATEYDGALVERKPTAVAFHYRRIEPARRDEAASRAAALADGSKGLRLQPGHMVVEFVTGDVNKGDALDALRRTVGATATMFVGDEDVAALFGRLHSLRAARDDAPT